MGEEGQKRVYEVGPRRGRRAIRWKRLILWGAAALLLVVLVVGGSSYLWFRGQIGASNERVDPDVVAALEEGAGAPAGSATPASTPADPSGMNIVLLGSDRRSDEEGAGRSDSIMLIHVDPDKGFLSVLSIPRDLRVEIPGRGANKINAAYAWGGPALTIRTIQSVLGIDLDHYIEVDFNAFKAITDTLGGVYTDVDRAYFYDGTAYEKIDIAAGYQLLDGATALDFVRFRHDSNVDFGRMERQQRFLSAMREQALGGNLAFKLPGLIKGLFGNVNTDLSANEILKLAYWGVRLDGSRMKLARLHVSGETIDGTDYAVASEAKIAAAVEALLTPPAKTAGAEGVEGGQATAPLDLASADLTGIKVDVVNATGRTGQGAFAALWLLQQGANVHGVADADEPAAAEGQVTYPPGEAETARLVGMALGLNTVEEDSSAHLITATIGRAGSISGDRLAPMQARAIPNLEEWQALAAKASFPLVAPTYIPPTCRYSYQFAYPITVGNRTKPAVRVGYRHAGEDQYLGVSETTWLDAPIASPGAKLKVGDIIYTVVGSSTKCDHVWWTQDKVLHWVSNTLLHELTREQLITVALSTVPVP